MFWLVMTALTSVGAVTYLAIAGFGGHLAMSPDRRRKFHSSGILLIAWAAVCYGHYMTHSR